MLTLLHVVVALRQEHDHARWYLYPVRLNGRCNDASNVMTQDKVLLFRKDLILFICSSRSRVLGERRSNASYARSCVVKVVERLFLPSFCALDVAVFEVMSTRSIARGSVGTLRSLCNRDSFQRGVRRLLVLLCNFSSGVGMSFHLSTKYRAVGRCGVLFRRLRRSSVVNVLLDRKREFGRV